MRHGRTLHAKQIKKINIFNNEEFGIYRDDELAVIQSKSPRTAENTAKGLHRTFHKWGFKITIDLSKQIS